MKFLVSLFAVCCFSGILNAQVEPNSIDIDQLEVFKSDEQSDKETIPKLKKFVTNVTVGTSFSYSPGNFYGQSYYVAPSFTYLVNQRFSLSAGIALQQSRFYPLYSTSEGINENQAFTQAFVYIRGSYLLNPRLRIGGTIYKSINGLPRLGADYHSTNYNYQGMSLDLQYKISNSFSVGFEMRMQNGSYTIGNSLIPFEGYVPVFGF